ncbi:MAG: PH domain-containing protein [Firmicutes bacterium]|nr:PH domain-containing protein [Bacillota bacterium]
MVFVSKRDNWLGIVIGAGLVFGLISCVAAKSAACTVSLVLAALFTGWIWFGTAYVLTGSRLIIKCGPFRQTIDLKDIAGVKRTRNPLSAPALSLQRLEIKRRKGSYALISPQEEARFLEELKKRNPGISVE